MDFSKLSPEERLAAEQAVLSVLARREPALPCEPWDKRVLNAPTVRLACPPRRTHRRPALSG
jgi:hypothetical protein